MKDPIKVYDARWERGEFSDDEIRRLFAAALAYGRLLEADAVTLTRDARTDAGHVLELGTEVALDMGFRVLLRTEPISTPQSYFTTLYATRTHPRTMGLTITASHNPRQYVGVKFTVPIVRAVGIESGPMGGLTKIRELYHCGSGQERRPGGSLRIVDLCREYIDYSMRAAGVRGGDLSGMAVVVDGLHGAAGPEIHVALANAGARVEPLRLVPDGNFPTGAPNPTSRGKMRQAVALAKERGCDAVVGLDGDGDRIVFGSARGILTAGSAFIPVLRQLAVPGAEAPLVLYDPKVSPPALAAWRLSGIRPLLFRNGHSQIKDYMRRVGAVAAAEESGHYYHRLSDGDLTISAENTVVTVLSFLRALRDDPAVWDELWRVEDSVFTTGEFNYRFESDRVRDAALDATARHFAEEGAELATATPDGVDLQGTCIRKGARVEGGDAVLESGWFSGYLRMATNEKSVLRSYFSAEDEATGRRVESTTRAILETRFGGTVVE